MTTERKRTIRKWPIVVFALLLLGGIAAAGISFAKMVSTPNDVSGSKTVAVWSISAVGTGDDLDLVAGGEAQTYNLLVSSTSDVACEYVITVSNVPAGVKVGIDDIDPAVVDANGTIVFDGYSLDIRSSMNHALKFVATLDADPTTNQDIDIDVEFEQVEPEEES